MRPLAVVLVVLAVATCSPAPSPTARQSAVPSSTVAQQRICGRLTLDRCATVISVVQDQVPGTRQSALAIADESVPSLPVSSDGPSAYFVAFAPWDNEDYWMSPPTWLVTESNGTWSLAPEHDVNSLQVCFVELLRQAGLTDYAPSYPSGLCQT